MSNPLADLLSAADPEPEHDPALKKKRKKLRVSTVFGELFILAGLAVLGYIVWQPWHTGVTVQAQQQELSSALSEEWIKDEKSENFTDNTGNEFAGEIAVMGPKAPNESFAILYVPAFGKTFSNVIAEGTSMENVLNLSDKGIGRYESTQLFGEVGNVGLSAHRSGAFITPFRDVTNLRVGDPLFIETQDGWYVYRYRSTEYVPPTAVEVLNPFPHMEGVVSDDRILTLTSCHPKEWSTAERVISYSVFEEFIPKSEGPPAELIELNPRVAKAAANV